MSPRPPAEPGYFPIFLRLEDEPVLVVGDGQ
jgi:siroheme synthase (precorrin-2 oxidase/ferrochelatase)